MRHMRTSLLSVAVILVSSTVAVPALAGAEIHVQICGSTEGDIKRALGLSSRDATSAQTFFFDQHEAPKTKKALEFFKSRGTRTRR